MEFDEVVIADNKKHAKLIALRNNPESIFIDANWTFKL